MKANNIAVVATGGFSLLLDPDDISVISQNPNTGEVDVLMKNSFGFSLISQDYQVFLSNLETAISMNTQASSDALATAISTVVATPVTPIIP